MIWWSSCKEILKSLLRTIQIRNQKKSIFYTFHQSALFWLYHYRVQLARCGGEGCQIYSDSVWPWHWEDVSSFSTHLGHLWLSCPTIGWCQARDLALSCDWRGEGLTRYCYRNTISIISSTVTSAVQRPITRPVNCCRKPKHVPRHVGEYEAL